MTACKTKELTASAGRDRGCRREGGREGRKEGGTVGERSEEARSIKRQSPFGRQIHVHMLM